MRTTRLAPHTTPWMHKSRRRRHVICAAKPTLYELLGVEQGASDRDIKRAYRQKALKLHPDVNKAPDAEAQFLEVKNAFSVLSDARQRTDYDRSLRLGSWGANWGGSGTGGGFGGFGGSGDGRPRPQTPPEDFYGLGDLLGGFVQDASSWAQRQDWEQLGGALRGAPTQAADWLQQQGARLRGKRAEDLFNDLGNEINKWSEERTSQRGGSAGGSASAAPKSLWEELAAVGEELVDYLEDATGVKEETPSSSAGFRGDGVRTPLDDYDVWFKGDGEGTAKQQQQQRQRQQRPQQQASQPPPPPPPPKSKDDEVEEMLAALKRKVRGE